MIKIVSVEKMRQIEKAADASGVTYDMMMQNAGRAVAERVLTIMSERLTAPSEVKVTVLVGPGNNGGDGLVAGRIIAEESVAEVRFYLLKPRDEHDPNFKAVREMGLLTANAEDDQGYRVLRNMINSSQIVVDALFGIGIRLPIKDEAQKLLRNVNQALHNEEPSTQGIRLTTPSMPYSERRLRRPYVVAVDCPSGLDCDTGELDANAIYADETVTFIAGKPGQFLFPGAGAVGKLSVSTIGVPKDLELLRSETQILADGETISALLPPRPANAHKGTFGKALVVAGSVNYIGAPGLAAMAAYRVGAGLVTVGAPHAVVNSLASQLIEPTWLLLPHDMGVISAEAAQLIFDEGAKYDALLLGPGWGREDTTRELLTKLLDRSGAPPRRSTRRHIGFLTEKTNSLAEASDESETRLPPLVIDADGLNLLSEISEWWKLLPALTILTPHPGEMARLTGLTTKEVEANRWELARSKASEWDVVLVLKGAHTVIAAPDGQLAVLPFKTPALATAGTGDVLAGAITGLLAQGMTPFDAALAGAYLHGLAGELVSEWQGNTRSIVARDVLDALAEAIGLLDQR